MIADRLRLMLDYYHPAGHDPLSTDALALLVEQSYVARPVSSAELDRVLAGTDRHLSSDVANGVCTLMGVPTEFLSMDTDPARVKQIRLQLEIVIEIRDRGIQYLAGRRGADGDLSTLERVLETLRQVTPPEASEGPALRAVE